MSVSKLSIETKKDGEAIYADEFNAIVSKINELIDFRNLFGATPSAGVLEIKYATVFGLNDKYTYSGSPVLPNISLYMNGGKLVAGTDYVYEVTNNDGIGTGKITIIGQNAYTGTLELTFAIEGQKYSLSYNVGTEHTASVASKSVSVLSDSDLPTLTADGYSCSEWYYDAALTQKASAGETITANTVLYAKWVQIVFKLSFNANGHGTTPDTVSVAKMPDLTASPYVLTDATTVYEFGGWYTDEGCTTEAPAKDTALSANTTLYAKWTKVKFTLSYELNGHGTAIASALAQTIPTLTTPTEDGYYFAGWFTDTACTVSATAGTTLTADTTLYAKWVNKEFAIVLEDTSLTLTKTDTSADTTLEYSTNGGTSWNVYSGTAIALTSTTTIQARLMYNDTVIAGGAEAITTTYDADEDTLAFATSLDGATLTVTKDGATDDDDTIDDVSSLSDSTIIASDGTNTATVKVTNS